MAVDRTDAQQRVGALLRTAKDSLNLSMAFLTRLDGTTQHLEVVESSIPFLMRDGITQKQETSLCQAILDGELPQVIPDLRAEPVAMTLPAARMPRIRSYVSVPVILSDGTLYGTFCAAGLTPEKKLSDRDLGLMEVLANAASLMIEPEIQEQKRQRALVERFAPLINAGGPTVVLQPIVELASGRRVGAEALSRFPAEWGLPPDVCFEQAHDAGVGDELELLALSGANDHLAGVSGYVSMNVSPATLMTSQCRDLLASFELDRVLLELSEHDQVADYDDLAVALKPLQEQGMKLAIDDVGSGFSSLRHVVLTDPDVIKIDRDVVTGVTNEPTRQTLVKALVEFGHGCGAQVVAEGIETEQDADLLTRLGVDLGQGWHFGRPGPPEELRD